MGNNIIAFGLTGQLAAGKGVIAAMLVQKLGFTYYSLSDRVREIAKSQERAPENGHTGRESLQNVGNETRAWFGGDALAKLTAGHAFTDGKDRVVFDGIRNPAEVSFLKKIPGFVLIAVTASREKRWENMRKKNRPTDPKTWEEFCRLDDRDLGIGEKVLGQNVAECIKMAQIVITNEDTEQKLIEEVTTRVCSLGNNLVTTL